jgi:hypothetical protein
MEALTIDLEDFENFETASFQGIYLIPIHYWYTHISFFFFFFSFLFMFGFSLAKKRLAQINFREK